MVVSTVMVVALLCSACGKLDLLPLSFFNLSRKNTITLECTCGAKLLTLKTRDRKNFWVRVGCVVCETEHLFKCKRKEIWSPEGWEIYCTETEFAIGFIGPKEKVKKYLRRQESSLEELASRTGFFDYFYDPEVMYQVLAEIYKLVQYNKLSCHCGNQEIQVDIFANSVELRCDYCRSKGTIMAQTPADLDIWQSLDGLELTPQGIKRYQNGAKGIILTNTGLTHNPKG
jgi:DNA-directed RNA polymerase subunit RPC12/RpoP